MKSLVSQDGKTEFEVLHASVEQDISPLHFSLPQSGEIVRVIHDDHSKELQKICGSLREASMHSANSRQKKFLQEYEQSFRTGDLEAYRESQRTWVKDLTPTLENIFGFVEPYRDPFGIRAEFEGLVAISDPDETKALTKLVENSTRFISRLPWAEGFSENSGKGPFEKVLFEPPDFTNIHGKPSNLQHFDTSR